MKILALDAATEACSVALYNNGEVTSKFEITPQQHSQKLLPFVDEILKQSDVTLQQLDGIAYGQGPGSFTGVRIGVAICQGLAFGADVPVVGISSIAAMAQQAIAQLSADKVVGAIDARMAEVYWGCYENKNGLAMLVGQEAAIKPDLVSSPEGWQQLTAVGTGWQAYQEQLAHINHVSTSEITLPNAEFMLPLALAEFNDGKGIVAELAQPNYVRDEVTWKKLPGR